MPKSPNKQTRNKRGRSNSRKSRSNSKEHKSKRLHVSKSKEKSYVSCFIVAHGCYLPNLFIIPHNMTLAFNTPLNQPFCGDTTNIEWNPEAYPYIVSGDITNDYLLDFRDNTSDLFSSFGVYFNNVLMYRGHKDIVLSHVLNYISTLTTLPIRVYCSICRNQCSEQDEDVYRKITNPVQDDDYADILDDLANMNES
jgi:hypothetical protein